MQSATSKRCKLEHARVLSSRSASHQRCVVLPRHTATKARGFHKGLLKVRQMTGLLKIDSVVFEPDQERTAS